MHKKPILLFSSLLLLLWIIANVGQKLEGAAGGGGPNTGAGGSATNAIGNNGGSGTNTRLYGTTEARGHLNVISNENIGGNLVVTGQTHMIGTLIVTDPAQFDGTADFNDTINLDGDLIANGLTTHLGAVSNASRVNTAGGNTNYGASRTIGQSDLNNTTNRGYLNVAGPILASATGTNLGDLWFYDGDWSMFDTGGGARWLWTDNPLLHVANAASIAFNVNASQYGASLVSSAGNLDVHHADSPGDTVLMHFFGDGVSLPLNGGSQKLTYFNAADSALAAANIVSDGNTLGVPGAITHSGPVIYPVAYTGNGNVNSGLTNSWYIRTNAAFTLTISGTVSNGQRLWFAVSNYSTSADITMTINPNPRRLVSGLIVSSIPVPSNSVAKYVFEASTNETGALEWQLYEDTVLPTLNFSTGLNTSTNNRVITLTTLHTNADDTAFASSWNGVTTIAPSKNAVYDWGVILQVGSQVLSNLVSTVANNVTNTSDGWGIQMSVTAGTLNVNQTNPPTLIASNATTAQIDFTGGTPMYQTADFMRTNCTLQLTNPIVGRTINIKLIGDGNAVNRTITLSTNGLTGNWPISYPFFPGTNGATAFTVTNGLGVDLYITAWSNRFSAVYAHMIP